LDKAKRNEMDRLGLSEDMLAAAKDVGEALERSVEGLQVVQNGLETQQRFAKRLDQDAAALYDDAKTAMARNEEETARKLLLQRQLTLDKLKSTLVDCAEMKKRLETMKSNVLALERRAMEVESLLERTVGAKNMLDTSDLGLALSSRDPLLQKFRDIGIE
jgi:phage shock protein A